VIKTSLAKDEPAKSPVAKVHPGDGISESPRRMKTAFSELLKPN